jgi:hypothetical protein
VILLQKGQTNEIVVTLREKGSLTGGYWLFVFQNELTRDEVEVIYLMTADTSAFPSRINTFPIIVNDFFEDSKTGLWVYRVYEQDDDAAPVIQNLVEIGIMKLLPASEEEITQYEGEQTPYKTFNGA